MTIGKAQAFGSELVDVWGGNHTCAIRPDIPIADIISVNNDHVRLGGRGRARQTGRALQVQGRETQGA
jgi:hypothetical protein